jgi:1,4-dihydroxy-2-naphthoyl-CoA hydrolase
MEKLTIPHSLEEWNARGREYLPGLLGIEILAVAPDELRARMRVERSKCAWNGFLHAGAVVSLADTCCGYATVHKGRTTQVWDTEVRADGSGKPIAQFRCTQMILYSR